MSLNPLSLLQIQTAAQTVVPVVAAFPVTAWIAIAGLSLTLLVHIVTYSHKSGKAAGRVDFLHDRVKEIETDISAIKAGQTVEIKRLTEEISLLRADIATLVERTSWTGKERRSANRAD